MASRKSILPQSFAQIVLVLLALSPVIAQTSQGTQLNSQTVFDRTGDCSLSDLVSGLVNDRSVTCGQGQTDFFHGEQRLLSGDGEPYATRNLYELTSCACSLGAVWTRVHKSVWSFSGSWVSWNWKVYGRNSSCQLSLKLNSSKTSCFVPGGPPEECPPCPEGYVSEQVHGSCECILLSPVVIDLEGDGIRMSSRADGVMFDFDGNGEKGQAPWTKDAWLVLLDEGHVTNGRPMFGNLSAQAAQCAAEPNGYCALSVFNDNYPDIQITPTDGVWGLLGVWRDANWNGIAEPSEVVGLSEAGIEAISLDYRESSRTDQHGNMFKYRAKVAVNGKERWSYDVYPVGE